MRRQSAALLALALALSGEPLHSATRASADSTAEEAAIGRWDITLQTPSGALPSWL